MLRLHQIPPPRPRAFGQGAQDVSVSVAGGLRRRNGGDGRCASPRADVHPGAGVATARSIGSRLPRGDRGRLLLAARIGSSVGTRLAYRRWSTLVIGRTIQRPCPGDFRESGRTCVYRTGASRGNSEYSLRSPSEARAQCRKNVGTFCRRQDKPTTWNRFRRRVPRLERFVGRLHAGERCIEPIECAA
jgi:hypothetical protein